MLQTAGLAFDYDQVVLRGDTTTRSFSAIYLRDGYVQALDCINAARDFLQGKRLITSRQKVDSGRLVDPAIKLGSLVSAV
jgi:3-phenylpropionate/trans-cinnamate dioxygenase ferredoxin reductase component